MLTALQVNMKALFVVWWYFLVHSKAILAARLQTPATDPFTSIWGINKLRVNNANWLDVSCVAKANLIYTSESVRIQQ